MAFPVGNKLQSPLNLIMPIKSWMSVKKVQLLVRLKTRASIEAADQVGTVHFLHFVEFHDHNKLGFFTNYDGDFKRYIQDFIRCLGPVFNALLAECIDPPPLPVEKNPDAFINWIADHNLDSIGYYSAYPTLSVQDITSLAASAPATSNNIQSPLTLVLTGKSPEDSQALAKMLPEALPKLYEAADAIGTVHFARFVPFTDTKLLFISEYDGDLEKHLNDVAKYVGPIFDGMFKHLADPPPSPVQQNAKAFVEWVAKHNLIPSLFYSAYPVITVKDIKSRAAAASA